jgi:sulfur-carrier protein
MPHVAFTAHLLRHVPCPDGEVRGDTLRAVLDAIFERHPAARGYVLDEHGALRRHVVVFIDGTRAQDRRALSDPVGPDSQVHVLQALTGG